MRRLALVALVACSGGDSRPRCVDAFEDLAKRLGDPESPALASMIGTCERARWSQAIRECVSTAKSGDDAEKCIEPARKAAEAARDAEDKKDLGAAPVPSDEAKKTLAKSPVRVKWFSRDGKDAVSQHVVAYFKAAGVTLEHADRMTHAEDGAKYRVVKDGTLVLVREGAEERSDRIEIGLAMKPAKRELANLDRNVIASVVRMYREKRKLYVTTGHGEGQAKPERRFTTFETRIKELNFERHEIPIDVLAKDVPADATIVAILGPSTTFSEAEQASLARYVDRGGGLVVAFDPTGIDSLGAVDAKLGAKLAKGRLTDDKSFLPQRKTPADHRFVVTNQYSAHATTSAVSRTAQGTILLEAGALDAVPTSAKTTTVMKSMDSSFLDLDDDFTFDDGKEKRARYDLVIASEGAKNRAVVLADVDLFADALVPSAAGGRAHVMMIGGMLIVDILRWVAGEEQFVAAIDAEPAAKPEREKPNPGRDALRKLADKVAH